MLAMTNKSDLRPRDTLTPRDPDTKGGEADLSTREPERMPLPSGLSALIQAATSQLGQLTDLASDPRHRGGDRQFYTISSKHEDGASSDGGERPDAPTRTPTMIPERDHRKQSFPELLMTLAMDPVNINVITFLPDGKFFVVRSKEFSEEIMVNYFDITTFEDFLELSHNWGFSRILQNLNCTDIEVFRHPQFVKGEWDKCGNIKVGASPTELRVSALPDRARIEYTLSDDSAASGSSAVSKRRLSPGFLARCESESSGTSQKQRIKDNHDESPQLALQISESKVDSEAEDMCSRSRTDDVRSIALAITTEKLNLKCDAERKDDEENCTPLIERAVESATHTIVTDAIESLLRDECHTKETYLKHEKELSRSSLPGVVPLSKQLFSPRDEPSCERKEAPPEELTAEPESFESSKKGREKADETIPELKSSSTMES